MLNQKLEGLRNPAVLDKALRDAVQKGADLLDRHYPDWDKQINPFDLPNFWQEPGIAIVTYLAGDIMFGYGRLGLTTGETTNDLQSAGSCGFLPPLADYAEDLAVTWVMMIASRNSAIPFKDFPRELVKIP